MTPVGVFFICQNEDKCHFVNSTILSRSPAWDEERGLSYTPCLLTKPALRLRLHDTQSQPCFPAASNALARPGGNLICKRQIIRRYL